METERRNRMRKNLNPTEKKEFTDLIKDLTLLWKRNYLATYDLSYKITKKDVTYYRLYIYKYTLVDGKRIYTKPTKYYKTYENMKEKIKYITNHGFYNY